MKKIIIRKTPVKKLVRRAQVVHHYHHYEKPKGSALKRLFWFTVVCGLIFAGVIKLYKDSIDEINGAIGTYSSIARQGMMRRQFDLEYGKY